MRLALATVLVAMASQVIADERIHLQPPRPSWCTGSDHSGACVRGPKDYRLDGARVVWREYGDPNAKEFFQDIDKDKFGIGDAGGAAAEGAAGK